ncbi:polysaccharide pyruvyl transferase family protein [Candidatus Gracilibacteria bacterium]|nr:polysaccharide pyruvyl transferase family protein [Candidatus Gracilibacteria bacterium]
MRYSIIGNYGVGNVGDEALLLGLKTVIKQIDPDAHFEVMGKGCLFPMGVRSLLVSLFRWASWRKPLKLAKSSNICILGGGGLFSDEERPLTGAFWALQGLVCHFIARKPVWVLGVSIGPMNFLSRILVLFLLRRAKSVVVRDKVSFEFLRRYGVSGHQFPDLAYFLAKPPLTNQENGVIISLKPVKNFKLGLSTIFVQFIDFITEKYGFDISLIAFEQNTYSDVDFLHTIFVQLKNKAKVAIIPFSAEPQKVLEYFSRAQVALCMRFHSGIFATLTGTHFINLAYNSKNAHFNNAPGSTTLNIKEISLSALKASFESLLSLDAHPTPPDTKSYKKYLADLIDKY